MCGIAGLLGWQVPHGRAAAAADRMVATLTHRGPDDHGVAAGDGWAIGMRRLAIQDLSRAGHQPMRLGELTIVYNGEVYNFPQLRSELQALGHEFVSRSDTEVVLHAFRQWGTAALERFNGMFALAIVDERRREAWLARDRFGKKPLFLAELDGRLAFASELKALAPVAAAGELTIDRDALAGYFRFGFVPAPQAVFEQVRKLPPASWVRIDLDRRAIVDRGSFWRLPEPPPRDVAPEEVLDAVREATRRRLIADVPVGAFLSGGTDSSLVVACMCDVAADVRTFSIGFADPRFDESPYAKAVAAHLATVHTHHTLDAREALDTLTSWAEAYDEPFADSSALPTMAVSRLARRDVTVAMSGDGGDELFGGYWRYTSRPVWRRVAGLPAPLARLAASPGVRRRASRLSAYASSPSVGAGYQEVLANWRRRELAALVPGATPSDAVAAAHDAAAGGPVERMMRADARTYLVDDILQKVDRATMAVSLEARNPLLDPNVVEVALAATGVAEGGPGRKPLLREALNLRLPSELVDRPKRGFAVPVAAWMRDELRELVEDLVLARSEAEYDIGVAHDVARRHLAGEDGYGTRLWSLVAYELWRERWTPDRAAERTQPLAAAT